MNTAFDSRWAWVRIYGAKVRHIGERLEFCRPALDDFEPELTGLEDAAKMIREKIGEIEGPMDRTIKVNREVLRQAWRAAWDRMSGEGNVFEEFEKEIFG